MQKIINLRKQLISMWNISCWRCHTCQKRLSCKQCLAYKRH